MRVITAVHIAEFRHAFQSAGSTPIADHHAVHERDRGGARDNEHP